MAAAPASTMLSTISLGPAAAPATNTPGRSVRVGASLGFTVLMKLSAAGGESAAAFRIPTRQHAQGQHHQIVLGHLHPAFGFLRFVPNQDGAIVARVKIRHLAFDKIDPHGLGVLEKLLITLPKGPDIQVVNGDIRQRQGAGQEHGLLDGIHAADPGAVRHAHALVPGPGALDEGYVIRLHAVVGPEDAVVRAVGRQQPLHLQGRNYIGNLSLAVLGLVRQRRQLKTGGDHRGRGRQGESFRLLQSS